MRCGSVSLDNQCCKPAPWSQKIKQPNFVGNVSSRSEIPRILNLPASVLWPAFVGGEARRLFVKQSSSGGAVRMATTVKGPLEESSPQMDAYTFGPWKIDPKEVFLVTEHCYAFVNLRPVVPDVLVTPKRLVPRFTDLNAEEVTDLWLTAQRVGQKLEPFFNASSLTLAIQDGPEAGQTVPHVHVHVLPRKKKDFEDNDMVYDAIDKKEDELNQLKKKEDEGHLDLDQERKDRTRDEMFDEASKLRALF